MYEEFYGFREAPFSLTHDSRFFYHDRSESGPFELLRYGIERGEGFISLYGAAGTGKTSLCRAVLENAPHNIYTAMLTNPFLSEVDLLRAILMDFGVLSHDAPRSTKRITKNDLVAALNTFLLSLMKVNSRAVVVIDEAQSIPIATLEQIRILSNLETSKEKLLQIILVGQPALQNVLARPELRQLNQRISIRHELLPFSLDETTGYMKHRLSKVQEDPSRVIFSPKAIKVIHEYSGGLPALINRIGEHCLIAGATLQKAIIDEKVVAKAVRQMELSKPKKGRAATRKRPRLATAIRVLLLLILVSVLVHLWAPQVEHILLQRWLTIQHRFRR